MPRLTYTPTGSDAPKVWDIEFGRMMLVERMAIEKLTGLGWNAVQGRFWANQTVVIHAFLWVLLKRDIPTLKADQVDFFDDEIDIDLTDAEAEEALAALRGRDDLDDDDLEAMADLEERLAALETEPAEADDAEGSGPKED